MRERSSRGDEATRPVKTVFLRRGTSTRVHHHRDEVSWTHVVSGDLLDERWHRDGGGRLVHEKRVIRGGRALAAPGDTLHRVSALTDVAFVTSCADDCGCAPEPRKALITRPNAQPHADRSALITAVGEPAAPAPPS